MTASDVLLVEQVRREAAAIVLAARPAHDPVTSILMRRVAEAIRAGDPELVHGDPPAPVRGRTAHAVLGRWLRARPGEWADLGPYPSSPVARNVANLVRRGKGPLAYASGFDAVSRALGDGTYHVFVRYVGGGGERRG